MSLQLIQTVTGIINYALYDGVSPATYCPYLIVPPRLYSESINSLGVKNFFYNPSTDRLVGFVGYDQIAWPGWSVSRYEWDAETGEIISKESSGIWAIAWHKGAGLGSYNKTFDLDVAGHPEEVDPLTLTWTSPLWKRNDITLSRCAMVNLQDNLLVGINDWFLLVYDLSTSPPTAKASMRIPALPGYLCMESREICWVITHDGLILKANYKNDPPRWEMLSGVQRTYEDAINYLSAWDTKRGRLVVLCQRADAEDGACQCLFEFYKPLVKIVGLTDPVPVGRHRGGDITEFVAHLYGSAGEGVTPYRIIGSLQPEAKGGLLRAEGTTTLNGAVSLLYQAPASVEELESVSETIILETSITDGAL